MSLSRFFPSASVVLLAIGSPCPVAAQIALPSAPGVIGRAGDALRDDVGTTLHRADALGQTLDDLAQARLARLQRLAVTHRDSVELDDHDQPARAHDVLLLDPDAQALQVARGAGFTVTEQASLGDLGIAYARLAPPRPTHLARAIRTLRHLLPGKTITADQLHFPGGTGAGAAPPAAPVGGGSVGVIDGGVQPGGRVVAQAGFATGAPRANGHAQAIVSLLVGAGTARIVVADVYGSDTAGGNALALARALAWMLGQNVPVVSISLVGPPNPLLSRAIAQAQARGLMIVGAVGNDGAGAPPAYPASYPGVIAVTGVDGHGRVLFEAGHALHLDYAAPGADLTAIGIDHRPLPLRGTSFAAPLVAARLAAFRAEGDAPSVALRRADHEAVNPGARTGRGILCDACRHGI